MATPEEERYLKTLAMKAPSLKDFNSLTPEEAIMIKNIIRNFISINNLIVYGGNALNAILPPKDRFYSPDELSDYDILSPAAKEHAKALADIFYDHGFIYTEVSPAMHEGTFKVYVNFEHVADITNVSSHFFEEMLKISKQERKHHKHLDPHSTINIAPIYLLKHFVILELGRPNSSLFRWPKVYSRLALLNKHYNPQISFGTPSKSTKHDQSHAQRDPIKTLLTTPSVYPDAPPEVPEIFQKLLDVFRVYKIPIIGNFALGLHLGKNVLSDQHFVTECCRLDEFFSVFEVLSEDPAATFELIKSSLTPLPPSAKLVTQQRFYYGDIMPTRLRVYLDITSPNSSKPVRISLATIVSTGDACHSTTQLHGLTVGSVYTILSILYAYYLVYRVFESLKIANKVKVMIEALETHIAKNVSLTDRFITECYGREKSILTVKKEIFMNPSSRYLYRPGGPNPAKASPAKQITQTSQSIK